jgi:hypothetical protein
MAVPQIERRRSAADEIAAPTIPPAGNEAPERAARARCVRVAT